MRKRKKKRRLKKKVLIIFFLLLVIVGIGCYALLNKEELVDNVKKVVDKLPDDKAKEITVIDINSKSRPIAVMINNHPSARKVHTGLQEAYITYEIIVEGGYSRYMALYKDVNLDKIGSIRSSRHYFLDYVLENDAIYVHWGWSPEAESDIEEYGISNINGLTQEQYYFFRDNNLNVGYEHRGFTKSELIADAIEDMNYNTTTGKNNLLDYSVDNIDLSKMEGAIPATEVYIPYSGTTETEYKYDVDNKVYLRYVNDVAHTDYVSKKQYTVKNIITYQVSNSTLTGDVKGRQDIDNIGSGEGYYITNGYAVPIKWSKKSRTAQTVYTYTDGTEIKVNDGNTYIQIQPKSQKLTIE